MDISQLCIRNAGIGDIDALVRLWKICFPGDSEDYIRYFYQNCLGCITVLCGFYGDVLAGMVHLIPAEVSLAEEAKKAFYGYAIGVRPEFRGKGVFKELHGRIIKQVSEESMIYVINPANEKLARYYMTCGMSETGYLIKREFTSRIIEKNPVTFYDVSPDEYMNLRDEKFKKTNFVRFKLPEIGYALDEKRYCGGFAKKTIYCGKPYLLLGDLSENSVTVNETTLPDDSVKTVIPALAAFFGRKSAVVFTDPEEFSAEGGEYQKELIAMTYGYNSDKNLYLSLTLG